MVELEKALVNWIRSINTISELTVSLKRGKSRTLTLIQNLEAKDQLIAEAHKVIRRLKENILCLEAQIIEECRSPDSSLVSDDDLHSTGLRDLWNPGQFHMGFFIQVRANQEHDKLA